MIAEGFNADMAFLDKNAPSLRNSRNLPASIVLRCNAIDVRKVMVDGRFVLEK